MAEGEAGLELPIGLTEQKFLQQLARIESRAIRSAQRAERGFVKSNQQISRSFGQMSGAARGQLQNVSFQLQDIFVQISSGTDATRALGQQLPQLLSGFGAFGALLGLAASAAIPLAAALFSSGEKAKTLDESIKGLNDSLSDYYEAVEAANIPTSELAEKYGVAAGAAQLLLEQLAQIAKLDAASALRESGTAIAAAFEDIPSILALVDSELEQFGDGSSGIETLADSLREKFGLTIDQARDLQAILADQQAATTVEAQADAMLRLAQFLGDANEQAGYTNDTLIQTNKSAAEGALAANEMAVALDGAAVAAGGVLDTVDQLPGSINAATASAVALTRALGAAIAAANSVPGTIGAPSLDRFGNGEDITTRAGGLDRQEQQNFRYDWMRQLEEAEAARAQAARSSGGGGSRKRGGSGRSGSSRAESPFFGDIEKDLLNLERQISLVGKSNEEVATAKARWELLDEAKKRGLPVNAELNAQIDAQAAQVGRLTAELEAGEQSQQQFEDAIDGVASSMAGALLAGESLREGLAQVFKRIAADILSSGIRNAITSQFGAGSGGGLLNAVGSFFGGARGFASGGYTGAGSRNQVAGLVHKDEYVMSAPAVQRIGLQNLEALHRGGSVGGGPRITINNNAPGVQVQTEYATKDEVRLIVTQAVGGNNRRAADAQYLKRGS